MEENILDFTWTVISFAILMLYHFVLLVGFSNVSFIIESIICICIRVATHFLLIYDLCH